MFRRENRKSVDTRYLEWCDKAEKVFDDPLKQYSFLKKNDLSARHLLLFLSESAQKNSQKAPVENQMDPSDTAQLLLGLSETIRHMRHDLPEEVYTSILTLVEDSLLNCMKAKTSDHS
ncbi:hypothetical protein [Desmospora profundinema]|uniref:Uncharacterized protein n=1 Tax=Desmospora profundinema TaxID=1571184 RepID=A0ABU1ILU5_9BACL|nr:hypothetical protein [Desmospora profundinema]MDR6224755.1 hypothetical protein [Desmospora profundinema]